MASVDPNIVPRHPSRYMLSTGGAKLTTDQLSNQIYTATHAGRPPTLRVNQIDQTGYNPRNTASWLMIGAAATMIYMGFSLL